MAAPVGSAGREVGAIDGALGKSGAAGIIG